jgi:hypothetical protein
MKRDISFTHNMEKNYNGITINPNKSFQPTGTADFEFTGFDFRGVWQLKPDVMFNLGGLQ